MPRSGQATVNTTFRATDQMRGPMRNMQRNVSGFSRNTQRSLGGVSQGFRTLRRVAGLAIAVMTTGAIARSVQEFAAAGDEVAKMSRELGLGAEALQELRFAADRQGVSASDLEKALGALNNRVGQLRQGQGSLYTMLSRSNPALAEQLQNAGDTEEAFTLMMQAMDETTNAQDRAALAQAAFGRSGQTLVRMAEAGSAGLEDLRAEARRLGLVMSEEATAESEKFQDAMTNLKGAITGVKNNALGPLVASLTPLIDRMGEWVAANQGLIQQKIEDVISKIGDVSHTVYRLWDSGLIPAILAGVVAFKAINAVFTIGTAVMGLWAAAAGTAAVATGTLGTALAVIGGPITLIAAAIAGVIALVVFLIRKWDDLRERFLGTRLGKFFDNDVTVDEGRQRNADRYGLTTSNTAGIQQVSRSESVSRSEVDVNFRGAPRGTQFSQRGRATGVSLNYGAAGGRL